MHAEARDAYEHILDSAGAPVRGARVTFTTANGLTFTTISNAFGLYRIDALPSGASYTAAVTARTSGVGKR